MSRPESSAGFRLRLLGVALVLLLTFPAAARAQLTNIQYTTTTSNNQITITGFSATGTGSLSIPSKINNLTVVAIGPGAFESQEGLTSVIIPNGVTSIGQNVFYGCTYLTSVTIPASVTTIGPDAFESCFDLTNAVFLGNAPTMGSGVFLYAGNSTSGFTVSYLSSATGFSSPTWTDSSGDTYASVVPTNQDEFTTTAANGQNTVTGYTGSSGAVVIPATINGLPVVGIGANAFASQSNLTSVTIPTSITSIGNAAFSGCTSLTTVTMPGSVTTIGEDAFQDCSSLKSVAIGSGVTAIGNGAFSSCPELTSAVFLGNAPTMGTGVFLGTAPSGFSVGYYLGVTGFTSPAWTDSSGDSYPAINLGTTSPADFTTTSDGHGGLVVTGCNHNFGAISIPETINGLTVTGIGANLFFGVIELTSITLPDTLASIGQNAFSGCDLSSVTIPASVTSIGAAAFQSYGSLQSAVFLGNAPTMGTGVFANTAAGFTVYYYQGATDFTSPTWTDSSSDSYPAAEAVTQSASQFTTISDGNGGLVITGYTGPGGAVVVPATLNGLPVTGIGANSFINSTTVTRVAIIASVTSIGDGAFENCTNLTSVTIPESVTNIASQAFEGSGLTSVTIPYGVTSIGASAFANCTSLTSLTIPASPKSGPMVIGNAAFHGCVSLANVTLSSGVTSIGNAAFQGCVNLTRITIPYSITSIGNAAFSSCSNLTSALFVGNAPTMATGVFSGTASGFAVDYYNGTGFTAPAWSDSSGDSYPAVNLGTNPAYFGTTSDGNGGLVIIGYNSGAYINRAVIIPGTINGLPVTAIGNGRDGVFIDSVVTSVIIPNSVTTIGESAFSTCQTLTSVTIPDSVTTIGEWAFSNCATLPSVTIPNSVTSIGDGAFDYCTSLTSITVSPQNSAYSSLGGILFNLNQTALVIYPAGLTGSYTIPGSVTSIEVGAFDYCPGLTSVTIPSSVTSIGPSEFADCTGLTSITVSPQNPAYSSVNGVLFNQNGTTLIQYPAGNASNSYTIPASVSSIGSLAFIGSASLTNVTIPTIVTSIGDYAFDYCTGLTSVTIPASVTTIGTNAFHGCTSLTSTVFLGNAPSMGGFVFAGVGSGFTVDYYLGATGFTSPSWTPDSADSYPAVALAKPSFSQWAASYNLSSAASAAPRHDGVPNLLKYLYGINPTVPMTATDRAALPVFAISTTGTSAGNLTLTFRESPVVTGITISVQTSPDLQTWTTLTNPTIIKSGTDTATGDPMMQVQVVPSGGTEFLRLNVTMP